jgi:hypothetical protein
MVNHSPWRRLNDYRRLIILLIVPVTKVGIDDVGGIPISHLFSYQQLLQSVIPCAFDVRE